MRSVQLPVTFLCLLSCCSRSETREYLLFHDREIMISQQNFHLHVGDRCHEVGSNQPEFLKDDSVMVDQVLLVGFPDRKAIQLPAEKSQLTTGLRVVFRYPKLSPLDTWVRGCQDACLLIQKGMIPVV